MPLEIVGLLICLYVVGYVITSVEVRRAWINEFGGPLDVMDEMTLMFLQAVVPLIWPILAPVYFLARWRVRR